jgi:hypothetical protein
MAKKYLNGWQAPEFYISGFGPSQTITLKLRYQAMIESVEEKYIEHELLDGTIAEKFLYAHYFWELNYSAFAEASELIKIKKILNALQKGCTVRLRPHKEIAREFIVTTVKDRRTLGRHYGGVIAAGEKDFSITFRTMRPIYTPGSSIDWIDLDDNLTPVSEIFVQYHYMADEAGEFINDENGMPIIINE